VARLRCARWPPLASSAWVPARSCPKGAQEWLSNLPWWVLPLECKQTAHRHHVAEALEQIARALQMHDGVLSLSHPAAITNAHVSMGQAATWGVKATSYVHAGT
jgi:hypothetical protein